MMTIASAYAFASFDEIMTTLKKSVREKKRVATDWLRKLVNAPQTSNVDIDKLIAEIDSIEVDIERLLHDTYYDQAKETNENWTSVDYCGELLLKMNKQKV